MKMSILLIWSHQMTSKRLQVTHSDHKTSHFYHDFLFFVMLSRLHISDLSLETKDDLKWPILHHNEKISLWGMHYAFWEAESIALFRLEMESPKHLKWHDTDHKTLLTFWHVLCLSCVFREAELIALWDLTSLRHQMTTKWPQVTTTDLKIIYFFNKYRFWPCDILF